MYVPPRFIAVAFLIVWLRSSYALIVYMDRHRFPWSPLAGALSALGRRHGRAA